MKRLYRIRQLLSKMDQQRLMNEHDQMSMVYLKNPIEPGELIEYARGKEKEAKNSKWVGVAYVSTEKDIREMTTFVEKAQLGKVIVGCTSFPVFIKCRNELVPDGNVDVVLFKSFSKDQELLEFCTMVQELEDLDDFEYTLVIDPSLTSEGVQFDTLANVMDKSPDTFIVPHQMMMLRDQNAFTQKNKRHYSYDNRYYYVPSFDPSFDMDAKSTLYYTVRSPVKFVRMKNSFVSRTKAFKTMTFSDYYFDKSESVFFSLLSTERCVFLTSPKAFYVEEEPPKARMR